MLLQHVCARVVVVLVTHVVVYIVYALQHVPLCSRDVPSNEPDSDPDQRTQPRDLALLAYLTI